MFSSPGLLKAKLKGGGLANRRRSAFEPRFATRQQSTEKITGQGLQIGPNKTHSRTQAWVQHQEGKDSLGGCGAFTLAGIHSFHLLTASAAPRETKDLRSAQAGNAGCPNCWGQDWGRAEARTAPGRTSS